MLEYPVQSSEFIVKLVFKTELLAPAPTPSKNTSSPAPGTDASSCVLEAEPQFVSPVASQFVELPPPTQYLSAILFNY